MNQFSMRDIVFNYELEQIKNLMLYLEKVNVLWEEEKRNIDEKYKSLKDENYEHWDSVFADYEDEYHVFELFSINLKHSVYITAWMTFESMSRKIYEDIATKKGESKSLIKENTKFIDKLIKHLKSKPWKEVIVEEDLIDDIDRYKKVRNNIIHNNGQVQQGDLKKAEYKDIVIKSYRMDFSSEYLHEYVESICSFLEQMYVYDDLSN
ncbi:hypothetical protein ACFTQ7_23065 [Lysinibacillus sp. NPDC056959]|uniref:hypothetical protein n=1 Tax=Lysinibacillus sp. NPDC056959 TaxID=3345981 RepID=UPI00363CEF35